MTSDLQQLSPNSKEDILGKKEDNHLFFLDGLRGIAALVVMVGHARWLLWEGFSEGYVHHPDAYSLFGKILVYFLSIFRYGHQAVLFFFILSGFVIHLRYSKNVAFHRHDSFDFKDYFKRRIRRIYPPFLFIIFFTWILDLYGMHLGFSIYDRHTPNELINHNITTNHSFVNFIGNLFFLESPSINVWGTNGPLWSLKYEWWFYVLYPFFFLINKRTQFGATVVVILVFVISIFIQATTIVFLISVLRLFFFWWLGVFLSDIYTKRINISHLKWAFFVIGIPVMMVFEKTISNELLSDTCWALGFFGFLNLLFFAKENGLRFIFLDKLKWLGDCSYTLYIIHFPILVFGNGLILSFTTNRMPQTFLFVFIAIVLNILIAYSVHFLIETPFLNKRTQKS